MAERPDPLAPPEGYGTKPEDACRSDLTVCSVVWREQNCGGEVVMVAWVGCTKGEHAGPMPYCEAHGSFALGTLAMGQGACGQCKDQGGSAAVRLLKVERPDGTQMELPDRQDPRTVQQALDWVLNR